VLRRSGFANAAGELTIINGTRADGVVILTRQTQTITSAYVRADDRLTVTNIPDGVYLVYFRTGTDWQAEQQSFRTNEICQRFESTLSFVTTASEYTTWEITLHAVENGNARTEAVAPSAMPSVY